MLRRCRKSKSRVFTEELKKLPIPWRHILTDIHVWTGMIFHMGTGWVVYTMLTELPTYMKKVLHFDIEKLSFLSALPSLLSWITGILSGILSQWLRRKGYLSHLTTYKVFNGLSALGATACMVAITQVGYRPNVIVLLLAITGVCSGIFFGGSYVNHLDLAVNYAGPISGILHTVINLSGMMIAPVIERGSEDKCF
ncbi:hypothetical protein J437_LFUL005402 [Ladona fulva]|uniref:Inorganic phosphate cotransporter n=1 Tax=Ladona fulva TaxID=123851 RepID=A0A8K0NXV4_LADFU|nr:hypothetical protein J437_LFUL005402 [Ladona fulva]